MHPKMVFPPEGGGQSKERNYEQVVKIEYL